MKSISRILLALLSFIGCYYFIYWISFAIYNGGNTTFQRIIALFLACCAGLFIWKKTGELPNNLAVHIIKGGLITGAVSFAIGFFGPIIFTPESNLGPLLGIFITGPVGFVVGLLIGAVYWYVRVRKRMI